MQMLNERADECVATQDAERIAIEIAFRLNENGEDYLYWVSVYGPDGAGLDPSREIDRDHIELGTRVKEPGWVEAEPQVRLLPHPVRRAVIDWAMRPQHSAGEASDERLPSIND